MNNIQEQLALLEEMKRGFGVVRTQEEIEDDIDKEYQERMKREEEQREQERLYKERLEQEQKERQEMNYMAHKEIFDFMKIFNELDEEDFYCVVELNNGNQYMAKPKELKRDSEYIMFYIERNVGAASMFENPYRTILEVNVNDIKGIALREEIKQEIVIIKKSKFGVMTEWKDQSKSFTL